MKAKPHLDIKTVRNRMGLTQVEFAIKLGVDPITISRWERGLSKPSKLAQQRLNDLEPKKKRR